MAPKLPGSTNPGLTTALMLKNITTLNNISTSPTILPDRLLGISTPAIVRKELPK